MARPKTRVEKLGQRYYIKQESDGDPRGNRYLGPFDSATELEIFAHRVIAKAKELELKQQEAEQEGAA